MFIRLLTAFLSLLLLMPVACSSRRAPATETEAPAEQQPAETPEPAPAQPPEAATKIFPYQYEEMSLDNGLKVILIPMKNAGLVSIFTVVHAGSRDEVEPGKSGFAHFFEHIMFRGTDKYSADRYNEIITEMGADTNAYTTDDYTAYYLHFPSRYLEKVMEVESDRFMNLKYTLPVFQTEAKAVLGEYNKNFANPFNQLDEKLRDIAFEQSSYKHTTMGFLKDVEDMPNEYDYSLAFFKRFYRPENATIILTGNFDLAEAKPLFNKYYSSWQHGDHKTVNPKEPEQTAERRGSIQYPGDTLPLLAVAYKSPAFASNNIEYAALVLLSELVFGETSPLYERLVLNEQKVDLIQGDYSAQVDPFLFGIYGRLKDPKDLVYVENAVSETLEKMKMEKVDEKRLHSIKSNLKYGFLMSLDTSRTTTSQLATIVELTRGIAGIDELYNTFDKVTPEDIQKVAQKYFQKEKRTVVTLTGGKS